jgi:hypothetical protein
MCVTSKSKAIKAIKAIKSLGYGRKATATLTKDKEDGKLYLRVRVSFGCNREAHVADVLTKETELRVAQNVRFMCRHYENTSLFYDTCLFYTARSKHIGETWILIGAGE